MAFGWKRLIPISLLWIVAVATIRSISLDGGVDRQYLLIGIGVLAVLFLVHVLRRRAEEDEEEGEEAAGRLVRGRLPRPADAGRRAGPRRRPAARVREAEPGRTTAADEEIQV